MASVDPYMPCPCGSGEKYKWCCQKVESYAERAQRMVESGQIEGSLKPLEEGLAKHPDNAWLLTRKALVQAHLGQSDEARATLEHLLSNHPAHPGATILLTRLLLETEGAEPAVSRFQQGLAAIAPDRRQEMAPLAQFLGMALHRGGMPIAALKHLELAEHWAGDAETQRAVARSIVNQRMDPNTSVWEKNPYRLRPVPAGVTDAFRESFERALAWAEEGLWASAASAFELLSPGSAAGAIADYNRGICCLWIADNDAAIASFRRYIARVRPTTEAVDLEALCQLLEGDRRGPTVEFVQLTWPIRDREGLIKALEASPYLERGAERPIDQSDSEAPPADRFFLLDRPRIEARPGLSRGEIPQAEGEILIGDDSVVLETYDDSRLDRLIDRFTTAAGTTIPPAHPRTKVLERIPRYALAMTWHWIPPRDLESEETARLEREQRAYMLSEVWPETPNPALGGRTPAEAARAGDAETAVRAAFRLLESAEPPDGLLDWSKVRERLGVPPEPAIDPATVEVEKLHLSRWSLIPVDQLNDDRVILIYSLGRAFGLGDVIVATARLIAERPSLRTGGGLDPLDVYSTLAIDAAQKNDGDTARDYIRRGREAETHRPTRRTLEWELLELQVSALVDQPDVWVPTIATLLERYRNNQDASAAVIYRLMRMGLVRPVVDPRRPDEVQLDMSLLDGLMERFGPRVTTASGDRSGELWTPETARGGASIWTPGSEGAAPAEQPGQERSRLILPGQ